MKTDRLKNNNAGFTLLEALVAISILMVAVAAPITIAQKGLSSAVYTKNQMTASYLAQDAIEYIKNQRDFVSINRPSAGYDWDGLSVFSQCQTAVGCEIDTVSGDIRPFSPADHLELNDSKFYVYNGSTETPFTRQINIVIQKTAAGGIQKDDEALVTVTVSWGESDSVVVRTLMYNY